MLSPVTGDYLHGLATVLAKFQRGLTPLCRQKVLEKMQRGRSGWMPLWPDKQARAAVRGRPETDWYRVFKRDGSIDVLARAVRSGTAQDGATEEITGCAESDLGLPRSAPM